MNRQLLKLVFVKGPKDGDILEYKPGSTIRVGRIVRGNEIAIKDAGISTKHLRIVTESENWVIQDLGSSNGTILNSETLDPEMPVNLCHGDIIKLGEYTSIVVNFVDDVQESVNVQQNKLPPRPRRNTRRLAVADPDPVEPVQEKQTRRGRPSKQDIASSKENDEELELPRKTRASRSRALEEEKGFEGGNEKKVNSRVMRAPNNANTESSCVDGKKVEITSVVEGEEDVKEEKKGNSRVLRGRNIGSAKSSCLNSVKLEIETTPKVVDIPDAHERKGVSRKTTHNKQIENAGNPCFGSENTNSEDVAVGALDEKDEKRITSIATRSKKKEIAGDSFLKLGMALNQARMSRAKKKKMEMKISESVEATNDGKENDAEEKAPSCEGVDEGAVERCHKEDDATGGSGSKSVEQAERELRKNTSREEDQNCSFREDGDNLQNLDLPEESSEATGEARECKSAEASHEASDDRCDKEKAEPSNRNQNEVEVEVDLGKMTLGEWFNFMECHLPKQIIDETEKMIEPMRMKASRVRKHIAEQKKAKGENGV